jgi:hypothetical protein
VIEQKKVGLVRVLLAALASSAVGCAPLHVRTAEAPNAMADFSSATTYRFLSSARSASTDTTSLGGGGTPSAPSAQSPNPILESPITLERLQQEIQHSLEARNYHLSPRTADLSIAYYLGVRTRLQVTDYAYGYPFWGWDWRWGQSWGMWPTRQVTRYEQGTIIIDVLDGAGRRLLWRGLTHVRVPHDEQDYPQMITKAVSAIMATFPGQAARSNAPVAERQQ